MIDVETQGLEHTKAHTNMHKGHLSPSIEVERAPEEQKQESALIQEIPIIQKQEPKKSSKFTKKKDNEPKDDDPQAGQ